MNAIEQADCFHAKTGVRLSYPFSSLAPLKWTPRLFQQASDEVELSALGIAIPLAEIYLDSGLLPT